MEIMFSWTSDKYFIETPVEAKVEIVVPEITKKEAVDLLFLFLYYK